MNQLVHTGNDGTRNVRRATVLSAVEGKTVSRLRRKLVKAAHKPCRLVNLSTFYGEGRA
jgi:hypothetical protein